MIHYQYKTNKGQKILGTSTTREFAYDEVVKKGDTIKVFVSENNDSCLIPEMEVIRNNWKL